MREDDDLGELDTLGTVTGRGRPRRDAPLTPADVTEETPSFDNWAPDTLPIPELDWTVVSEVELGMAVFSVNWPTLEASASCCAVTAAEAGLLSCCFRTCVKSVLILRTSWRSLILSEGKLRFRNWSRGRLRPLASTEADLELLLAAWEVVALDAPTGSDAGSEVVVLVEEDGCVMGVTAQGGGNCEGVAPPDVTVCGACTACFGTAAEERIDWGMGGAT